MQEFSGRVAVVTGAASGIGLALARQFGGLGMKVVLADVERAALAEAVAALEKAGVEAIGVPTDVSVADQVSALAEQARDAFGSVHIVCNNAGVFAGGLSWQAPLSDWEWLLGVNVWGVIHGIRSFVPILLEHGQPAHIVNTASMAGLISAPYTSIYNMTKHAVVSLSESLYHELQLSQSKVSVSVLCPELISTRIDKSERNRPEHLKRGEDSDTTERAMVDTAISAQVATGLDPSELAERVLSAIREDRFYILSDDVWRRSAEQRLEDVRLARNPTFAPPVEG